MVPSQELFEDLRGEDEISDECVEVQLIKTFCQMHCKEFDLVSDFKYSLQYKQFILNLGSYKVYKGG